MISLMFQCPLVMLYFFLIRESSTAVYVFIMSFLLYSKYLLFISLFNIYYENEIFKTLLPPSIKLLVLNAIYKIQLQFLQYRENTIFENNWKPEEITGQNSSLCSNTLVTGTEK